MKRVFILKIGSFIDPEIGDTSSIGLITGEPVNFGKLLLGMGYDVYLASDQNYHDGVGGSLKYFNLLDEWEFMANQVMDDDVVLLWQGGYHGKEHEPLCVRHYQFLKAVQDKNKTQKQYFMLTDTRLPLMNFKKYIEESWDVPYIKNYLDYSLDQIDIDVSQVTMLSQATKVNDMKRDIKNGEFFLKGRYEGNALLNHKYIVHLPMMYMPLFTHNKMDWQKSLNKKEPITHDLIFTVQSMEYFDEYRLGRLVELMMGSIELLSKYNVAIYGKHNKKAINSLTDYLDNRGINQYMMPTMMKPVKFGEMKNVLRNTVANLCISEAPYVKYDLLPNRIFESFATGCIPIIDNDIVKNSLNDFVDVYCRDFMPTVKDSSDVKNRLEHIKDFNLRMNSVDFFRDITGKLKTELTDKIQELF